MKRARTHSHRACSSPAYTFPAFLLLFLSGLTAQPARAATDLAAPASPDRRLPLAGTYDLTLNLHSATPAPARAGQVCRAFLIPGLSATPSFTANRAAADLPAVTSQFRPDGSSTACHLQVPYAWLPVLAPSEVAIRLEVDAIPTIQQPPRRLVQQQITVAYPPVGGIAPITVDLTY